MAPLVLLAGMNCTADLWTGGGLDDARTPILTSASMDAQVARLLDELPERFVLGGLSLGAIVGMALAVRAPGRLAGLILVSTNAKAPTAAQQEGWQEWRARLDEGATPLELQAGIAAALLSPPAFEDAALRERALAMGADTPPAVLRAQLAMQSTRADLRPGLRGLTVPTLIVSGHDDGICPPVFHREIAAAIAGSELATIPGGHLLPMEQPAAFGQLVRTWRRGL